MAKHMNARFLAHSLLISLSAVALTACGSKVDCNSSAVKKDALDIIQSHLDRDPVFNQMKPAMTGEATIESIKTVDTENDGKQSQCVGSYTLTYNEKPRSIDVSYNLAYLEDKKDTEVRVGIEDIKLWLFKLKLTEPPIKNGEEKVYDGAGRVNEILRWKNNQQDGIQEFYNPENNALAGKLNMVAGKKEGSEKQWTPDGQKLIADINWVNNQKEGSEKRWAPDGEQLVVDLNWVHGKKNGTEKRVRENDRKLMTDVVWKDDKATGFISSDGPGPYTTTQFKDGLKDGPQKSYDTYMGKEYLEKIENFKDDKLDGLTQQFNSDGKVIAETLYSEGRFVRKNATEADKFHACVDGWSAKFRTERGWNMVSDNTRREWESWCKDGKFPG